MGRYGRTVLIIVVIVALAALTLGFKTISIAQFQRGSEDTPLGLSLGLDLQGGGHLVYQANLTDPDTGESVAVTEDQMESLKRTIERRVNGAGLGEPIIQILGDDRLLVQMPGVSDLARAKSYIGETAQLEFKRREINVPREATEIGAADIVSVRADYLPTPSPTPEPASTPSADATPGADQPVAEAEEEPQPIVLLVEFTPEGAAKFEPILIRMQLSYFAYQSELSQWFEAQQTAQQASGEGPAVGNPPPPIYNRLDLDVSGATDLGYELTPDLIARAPTLDNTYAFAFPPEPVVEGATQAPEVTLESARERLGEGATVLFTEIQGAVDEDTGLSGDNLARAFPGQHAASGEPIVNLEFDDVGTRIFGELTLDIIEKEQETGIRDQIAIFLDGQELVSPEVRQAITAGTAIIEGDFTIERVRDLALLLEGGRLPVPIELIQERDVDAILGADSLAKSVVAGFVGLALVLTFMTLYYRLPGLVASVALVIYAALVLAVFKALPVTLTLSGVAALILSIGMAVDANILIFERMKEELRAGRTLLMSVNIGFDRAWPAIRDGNVSTLITCAILFWFADQLGASIVQGFAATLAIGVVISMFTAIIISRTLLRFLATIRFTRGVRAWLPSGGSEIPQAAGGD